MTTLSCPACVLLIEDDEALRAAIAAFLEARNYSTEVAESADHAIERMRTVQRPCLLLIDPLTIRLDWARLFGALGPNDRVATLPMVLVSVVAPSLFSKPAVVKRPIDFEILFRIVQDHCCGGQRGGGKGAGGQDALQGQGSG